jgi:hypothetical protein
MIRPAFAPRAGRSPWLGLTRFTFQPALLELAELEAGHALVRFACALALFVDCSEQLLRS